MPMAACYSMDLYCRYGAHGDNSKPGNHSYGSEPEQFTGETYGECKRQAQALGWWFTSLPDHTIEVVCPTCSGKRPKASAGGEKKPRDAVNVFELANAPPRAFVAPMKRNHRPGKP